MSGTAETSVFGKFMHYLQFKQQSRVYRSYLQKKPKIFLPTCVSVCTCLLELNMLSRGFTVTSQLLSCRPFLLFLLQSRVFSTAHASIMWHGLSAQRQGKMKMNHKLNCLKYILTGSLIAQGFFPSWVDLTLQYASSPRVGTRGQCKTRRRTAQNLCQNEKTMLHIPVRQLVITKLIEKLLLFSTKFHLWVMKRRKHKR